MAIRRQQSRRYVKDDLRRKQEMLDGNQIQEDRSAFANLPQYSVNAIGYQPIFTEKIGHLGEYRAFPDPYVPPHVVIVDEK